MGLLTILSRRVGILEKGEMLLPIAQQGPICEANKKGPDFTLRERYWQPLGAVQVP